MLRNAKSFSSFSVDDINKAKQFYLETLGLDVSQDKNMMGLLTLHMYGGSKILVYPKKDHTPATFTVLNFEVNNINEIVDALIGKGVVFEQYDSEYIKTDENGISRQNGIALAWFKDPAGNILSVIQTKE